MDSWVVVEHIGSLRPALSNCFSKNGKMTDIHVDKKAETKGVWFGVVDGCHSHAILSKLPREDH